MNVIHPPNQLSPFSPAILVRLLTLVAGAGIVLGGVAALIYFQDRDHEDALLRQQGTQRVDQECEFLSGEIASVKSDVLYLAEQETLRRFLNGDTTARAELEREYVRFATRRSVYDQIRFLDTSGKEVIRVNYRHGQPEIVPEGKLQAKTDRYYYRDALTLHAGDVFISEFDLNVEHGRIEQPLEPVLRCLTPVIDDTGTTRGLLALNYSGNHLLYRLDRTSLPGATLLVNSTGQYIQGPTPNDAWGWLLGHTQTFPRHFPDAWPQISQQPEGQFVTGDGMFTFRHLDFSADPAGTPDTISTDNGHSDALMLVAFLPQEHRYAGSTRLLTQLLWMDSGAMLLLVTFGWYWARSAAIRKQQAASIMASETRLRTLSDQLLTTQETERRNISRELHDDLGQQVTAISLDLRSAVRQQDAQKSQSLLQRAIEETDHLLKSLHAVATRVRPSVLDDLGLHEAVESLTAEVGQRFDLRITTRLDFDEHSVPGKVGENVYRILQEGLMNVVRHAGTQQAAVQIAVTDHRLHLTLEDDGIGFDPQQRDTSRLGLLGMQERTELLHGEFTLTSRPGTGTRIDVEIPINSEPSAAT